MDRTACSSRPASNPGSERAVRTPLARHVRTTPAERGNWLIFSSFCSTSIEIPSREERRTAAYGDRCSSLATAALSRGRRSIMGAGGGGGRPPPGGGAGGAGGGGVGGAGVFFPGGPAPPRGPQKNRSPGPHTPP